MSEQPQAYAPGLYGLLGAVNVFVVDGGESGVTIVDAGLPGSTKRILKLVEALGRTPHDVRHILITHTDFDHIGGLKALVKATGAAVYASAGSVGYIRRRGNPVHIKPPMSLLTTTLSYLFRAPVEAGQVVEDGQVLPLAGGIRVIRTPGHTSEHTAYFWERERVLFAGDLLNMQHGLSLSPLRITLDVAQIKHSAQAALALDPAVICVGHGPVWQAASDPGGIKTLLAAL